MRETICGVLSLLCTTATSPADYKTPFNRMVDMPQATISWDLDPDVVKGLIRDYLRSQGQVVKQGSRESFDCGQFYGSIDNKRTCRYVVWVEIPFDPNKP